ncbi:MAG: toxin-antitoxin system YwqK family antitoxin [Flavobacteriaceae bacterium]
MRTYILTLVLLFGCSVMAQQDTTVKTVMQKEGKLTKVSMYHENGQLAQEGYLKNNRLHGKWIKYSTDGKLVCVANYTKGERNGTWLFWDNNDLTEVEFKDNKIVQKISWEASTKLVDAQK